MTSEYSYATEQFELNLYIILLWKKFLY